METSVIPACLPRTTTAASTHNSFTHTLANLQSGILPDPPCAYWITQAAYLCILRLVEIIYIWWSAMSIAD